MKTYIRALSNISPQDTFKKDAFPFFATCYSGNVLTVIEPDYADIIDAKTIRRMGRIVKMGVSAALQCVKEAGNETPDAIVTATAYGCLADTDQFLSTLIGRSEEILSPTAFIQSTHNTVGAQIALILQCNSYNNTFVNGGLSFESALLDANMLLQEEEATRVLVGSVDEITELSHIVLSRFDLYKRTSLSSLDLFSSASKGTIAGEGAAFFLLTGEPSPDNYACLDGIATFFGSVDATEMANNIRVFLKGYEMDIADIDLVITGRNGDIKNDENYASLAESIFAGSEMINYKHLCGEYPTAVSFAVWLAANIVKTGKIPGNAGYHVSPGNKLRRILICNNYQDIHYSLILLSAEP